jgi:hypothetical protein
MIPENGVIIFKSDQGPYVVIYQKRSENPNEPSYPMMFDNETEPINYYTTNGKPLRLQIFGIPPMGYLLKTEVFLTLTKVVEFIQTLEVLHETNPT